MKKITKFSIEFTDIHTGKISIVNRSQTGVGAGNINATIIGPDIGYDENVLLNHIIFIVRKYNNG